MPGRHILKINRADSYYHVYARGAHGQNLFLSHEDFVFFSQLFTRYLGADIVRNSAGVAYEKLGSQVELLAYCVMGNHFHLLLYQTEAGSMQRLMRGVMTAYSRYYSSKYGRTTQLFESRYRASRLSDDTIADYVSRYIHTIPKDWERYPYSSIAGYLDDAAPDWLSPNRILGHFYSRAAYRTFVGDTQGAEGVLSHIQKELANTLSTPTSPSSKTLSAQ